MQGGRISYDFSDPDQLADFDLYTEFGKDAEIVSERLLFWTLAEQKAIYRKQYFSDVQMEARFYTFNPKGKLDCGFYLQASNVSDKMDGLTGWCVNIEHGANESTYRLKLHRFENGRWMGDKVAVDDLRFKSDYSIKLKVVVLSGILSAYTDDNPEPVFTYEIGKNQGSVGIRCFYAPNSVDDLSITAPDIDTDFTELNELVSKAEKVEEEKYTEESFASLTKALTAAKAVDENSAHQYEVDEACTALREALDGLTLRRSFEELTQLIARAKALESSQNKYTVNSYNSVVAVMTICQQLGEESSSQEISYWCNALQKRLDNLVEYNVGGAQR